MKPKQNMWAESSNYDRFMGRWSQEVAKIFLRKLAAKFKVENKSWLDLGCGTGVLAKEIQATMHPKVVVGVDPTKHYLPPSTKIMKYMIGSGNAIPLHDSHVDLIVSGLALNFMPNYDECIRECLRVLKSNGILSFYLWDKGMASDTGFLGLFWDTVVDLFPETINLHERHRYPICDQNKLIELFQNHNIQNINSAFIEIKTKFADFEKFWNPFLGQTGPAGEYLQTISHTKVAQIKQKLQEIIPTQNDGSISLVAKAVTIQGINPKD